MIPLDAPIAPRNRALPPKSRWLPGRRRATDEVAAVTVAETPGDGSPPWLVLLGYAALLAPPAFAGAGLPDGRLDALGSRKSLFREPCSSLGYHRAYVSFSWTRYSLLLPALAVALVMQSRPAVADELSVLVHRITHERREDLDPVINRLVYLASDEAADRVARLLGHPSANVRSKAAWVLGFLEAPHTRPALQRAVLDPHWEVRRDAIYALGRLSATDAATIVAERLQDSSREVRLEAARVIGDLGDRGAGPALRKALAATSDDAQLEVALLTAIGSVGDSDAVPVVRERLGTGGEEVHLAALRALVRLGDPTAAEEIVGRLQHEKPHIRRDAALLLSDVTSDWAPRALQAALASEEDAWVALGIAEALAAAGGEAGLRHLAEVSATSEDARLAGQAVESLARLEVRSEDIAEVRRRMAFERLRDADLPIEKLAADLLALGLSFEERVLALSEHFRGVPYAESPLGEGGGVDPGPLYRWDAVDCLTFVEQVIALAHLSSPDLLLPILNDVRYQAGMVAFGERNHLMEHQWLPNNLAKGWIRDITREVGGEHVEMARKEITRESWERRRGIELPLSADEIPLGTSALPIIPLEVFPEVMERVPNGAILIVVRDDFRSRPFRVTHLGFVVHRNGRLFIRHAARATYMSVIDELLETFVRRNTAYRSWPVTGFNILMPVENSSRAEGFAKE